MAWFKEVKRIRRVKNTRKWESPRHIGFFWQAKSTNWLGGIEAN